MQAGPCQTSTDELIEALQQLEALGTRAEVKRAVLEILTKHLAGTPCSTYGFMLQVAFAYINDIRELSKETNYSNEAVARFKSLWDGLPP